MTPTRAATTLLALAFVSTHSTLSEAQTALAVRSPGDSFTTRTPSPYVRMWVRNRSSVAHRFRVVSVTLTAPTPVAFAVTDVRANYGRPAAELIIAPNTEVLVTASFDDRTNALGTVFSVATYSVVYSVDTTRASIELSVRHAIRDPIRRR